MHPLHHQDLPKSYTSWTGGPGYAHEAERKPGAVVLFAHTSCIVSLPYNECWFVDDDGQANTMPISAAMGYV